MKSCLLIFFFYFVGSCSAQTDKYGAIKVVIADSTINDRYRLIIISEKNSSIVKDTITCSTLHPLYEGYYTILVKFPQQLNKIKWKNINITPNRLFILEIMLINGKLKRKMSAEKSKWKNCG